MNDLSNLSLHSSYLDIDGVQIGDGADLKITHQSSSLLSSNSTSFTLSNVLCVPDMIHNILSVSKFCTSNNVSVEFYHLLFL